MLSKSHFCNNHGGFFFLSVTDMMGMRRHCGCIAYDTQGPVGAMNAHTRIGHFLARTREDEQSS